MKRLLISIAIFGTFFSGKAQQTSEAFADWVAMNIPSSLTNSTIDIAAYFNDHLSTPEQKVRAAYAWVAMNIRYDASHLHRVILDEDKAEKVTWALERKKGVCENFAAIFTDICLKSNIRAYTVEGYTKNGSVQRSGHAWAAAFLNNNWFFFDPTWDAGFIQRAGGGAAQPKYYMIPPEDFISEHLPFDPMFQFVQYPFSFQEFVRGFRDKQNSVAFNFKDSIDAYEVMQPLNRYISAAARIEKNGSPTYLTATRLAQLRMEKEIIYQDTDVELYNGAVEDYKSAVTQMKEYIAYRNSEFQPRKPTTQIESMLGDVSANITTAGEKLALVKLSKANLQLNTGDVEKMVNDLSARVEAEKNFLHEFFTVEKSNFFRRPREKIRHRPGRFQD